MSFEKNLEYARLAAALGVDVLEAGFPSASKLDFSIVHAIAEEFGTASHGPTIAGLCQLREEQVDRTIESLLPAKAVRRARLHVYLPVDPNLMAASLGERAADKKGLVDEVARLCAKAYAAGMEVEFSPEGYSRMGENFDFTTDLIRAAVTSGASVINCPDTIGGAHWLEGEQYFVSYMKRHAEIIAREFPGKEITWSVHCHNDFGLALENSLNGIFHGPARQVEGCINGIGERAGNVSLEQVIMVIKQFAPLHDPKNPLYTDARTELIQQVSDFVGAYMLPRQPHSPISGTNAAKHSSGGHTNAILKNPLAYQAFDPRQVGGEVSFIFGPLSGGNHAMSIIKKHGFVVEENEKAAIAQYIKDYYSTRRKGVTDSELMMAYYSYRSPMRIDSFDYSRNKNTSEVRMTGKFFDSEGEIHDTSEGKDSALATLKKAIDKKFPNTNIESYNSESTGSGVHATSRSTILLRDNGSCHEGIGEDQDIEISAMKALIDAVNKAYIYKHYRIQEARAA